MAEKTIIFVNASTVLISGGLILAKNIIQTLANANSFELYITCPRHHLYKSYEGESLKIIVVPRWMLKRHFRLYFDLFWLPARIREKKPDIVLSLGNIPAFTHYWQIFLHDNPFLVEDNYQNIPLPIKKKLIHYIRCKIALMALRFVNLILVQTPYQQYKLMNKTNLKIPSRIVTPGLPQINLHHNEIKIDYKLFCTRKIKLLCLARYYEHKNIEMLEEVAKIVEAQSLPFVFYLTINRHHGQKAVALIDRIQRNGLHNTLINLGYLKHNFIRELIEPINGIVIPSLLESFSLSCIEAWHFRKPLFISDLESMKSACHDAAIYFNPYSPADMIDKITSTFNNPTSIDSIIEAGSERLNQLSDWEEYVRIIKEFAL